ncbi:MAG: class I SAM-dependent methyltransferase, partial [Ruminococcus sp.]|nr:class I SAM-dependent methyltransferase [Ruminococcus sp.]
ILLDLACGTGSLSEQLAAAGFDVIGVDSSQDMLNCALDKKFESGLPIQYLAQDMRKLDMFGTIEVTVCALDSINHLDSIEDVRTVFERVSLFAEPGGLFIFDINTLHKHRDILADNAYIYSFEDIYCGWQNEYDNSDSSVHIWLDIFEKSEGGWQRFSEDFREIYLPPELAEQLVAEAGLELLGVFDGYTDTPVREVSERAVYVCRKPAQ